MRRQLLALTAVLVLGSTACQRAEAEPAHGTSAPAEAAEQLAQAEAPTSQPTSMPSETDDEGHDDHEEHGGGTPGDQPYEWAVVGGPTNSPLFVLSRTPGIEVDVWTAIEARLAERGIDTTALRFTLQDLS